MQGLCYLQGRGAECFSCHAAHLPWAHHNVLNRRCGSRLLLRQIHATLCGRCTIIAEGGRHFCQQQLSASLQLLILY